jgi:hypothetical protein
MLVLALALAACGGGGDDDDDDADDSRSVAPASTLSNDPGAGGDDEQESDGFEAPQNESSAGASVYDAAYVANQLPLDRLVIRTVAISLTVEDVAQGTIWLRDLAARKSGFVFSSNTYIRDESEFAQITLRVPADQLDSTIQELREHDLVVQVDSEESTSQDVSQEFVDNEARLEALEETQRRFLALLSEADTVEDILRIESELTNIRSQIETIKGRQNYLSQMTSFSTVTITLHVEDSDIEMLDDEDDGFIARVFGDSWDSASGVIEGLLAATITLGIISLAVLPLALLVYIIGRFAYRRFFVQAPTAGSGVAAVSTSKDSA